MQHPADNQPEQTNELFCDRCDGPMERGFNLDYEQNGSRPHVWCPGDPTLSFWTGGVKSSHAAMGIRIVTYRCTRCGRLESFAPPPGHNNSPTA